MKRTESAKKTSKSRSSSTNTTRLRIPKITSPDLRFVVCVKTGGYVDLEPLKVYRVRPDPVARAEGLLRVIDRSGEDYLYPAENFLPIQAPRTLNEAVRKAR